MVPLRTVVCTRYQNASCFKLYSGRTSFGNYVTSVLLLGNPLEPTMFALMTPLDIPYAHVSFLDIMAPVSLIELNIALVSCIVCATASASPLEGLVECNGVTPLAILFYLLPEVLAFGDRDGCIHVATEVVIDTVTSSALPHLPASFIIVVCSK